MFVSGLTVPMDLDVKMKAVMILAAVIIVSCFILVTIVMLSSKILFSLYHRIATTLKDQSEHRKSCQTTQPYFPFYVS